MKKIIVLIILVSICLLTFSQISYDIGFSVLNENKEFNFALRIGLESEDFNFSFDLSPSINDSLNLITITDVSAKIWQINNKVYLDAGLLLMNDKAERGICLRGFKYGF